MKPNGYRAIGRSRSRSPRRRHHDTRERSYKHDKEKYRYVDEDNTRPEERHGFEYPKRTRWDVGDPERGRKQDRSSMRSRSNSPLAARRHQKRDKTPINGHRDVKSPISFPSHTLSMNPVLNIQRKYGSSKHRSHSRSPSSTGESLIDSSASNRRSRSQHKRRQSSHGHHRRRSPSSSSSSSSSYSRSRSRDRYRTSRDKDGKGRKRSSRTKREKRKRSRSPERRSILTGKKIKMKVHKTAEDHERDAKREELLKFLNSTYE
ncbi:hypothetical protein ACEPAH_7484 [Sanghuangporus vaninii]